MDSFQLENEKWRQTLDADLRRENSWLALAGLFWLDEGKNSFGTDLANSIVIPSESGADWMGTFDLVDDQVTLYTRDEVEITVNGSVIKETILKPDTSESPTQIKLGDLTFMLIDREDGLGIRLWDNQRSERQEFSGRVWFPIDKRYLIRGVYEPFAEDLDLLLERKNGLDFHDQAQGKISFNLEGRDHSLVAFEQNNGSLFTLFLDQTSGKECYPAGRYLVIDSPREGCVEINFNRAYNPPCAFTDFATCPLPPVQNRLEISIRAGERI